MDPTGQLRGGGSGPLDPPGQLRRWKHSLVMIRLRHHRVAGCIFIRPTYSRNGALTYLLTYLHSLVGAYKTGNISEMIEDKAKVTINGLCKVIHGLSIVAKIILP